VVSVRSDVVVLMCGRDHGSRLTSTAPWVPGVFLPAQPGRADLDPVIADGPRRVVVEGDDADLAAVLVRLLRTERLDIEVAYVAAARRSAAARAWGLPPGRAAAALALDGAAAPAPLVRDDLGGVLVGRGEVRAMTGEVYCDEFLVLRGRAPRLVVVPGPAGVAVRAGRGGRAPDGRLRAVPARAPAGRGSAAGRAVQLGGPGFTVMHDGVAHPREVRRWAWYRHTADWLLVRPPAT